MRASERRVSNEMHFAATAARGERMRCGEPEEVNNSRNGCGATYLLKPTNTHTIMTLDGCNEDILGLGNRARRAARASQPPRRSLWDNYLAPCKCNRRSGVNEDNWNEREREIERAASINAPVILLLSPIDSFAFCDDAAELRTKLIATCEQAAYSTWHLH